MATAWAYTRDNPFPPANSGFVVGSVAGPGSSYEALGAQATKDRLAAQEREFARQAEVRSGYDQQIAKSAALGQQGYDQLAANYAPITADALATRERNMARIDTYGDSMRSDLDIKNKQALAAASQSAIKRGLGNTTIQDSLVRGQNFDNTRQKMSLEDQLLQNRISTDASLSSAYQGALQNRAQGLASQWNQNISNDNTLASSKLGYIGGIKEDNSYLDIANIYAQGLQQENANQQAALNRAASYSEALLSHPQSNGNAVAGSGDYATNPNKGWGTFVSGINQQGQTTYGRNIGSPYSYY